MKRTFKHMLLFAWAAGLVWVGCTTDEEGDDDTSSSTSSTGSSTGTSTGSSSSSSSSSSSTSSSSSSGTGATGPGCDDVPADPPSDGACVPFGSGSGGGGGAGGGGGSTGDPAYECNPVGNDGCNGNAGEACDLADGATFTCFPSGNTEALCMPCNNGSGPWCQPGSTCLGDVCTKYCCTDDDCGPSLSCDKTVWEDVGGGVVGACL